MAERLVWQRTTLGLTQKHAAAEIGVDQGTLAPDLRSLGRTGPYLGS